MRSKKRILLDVVKLVKKQGGRAMHTREDGSTLTKCTYKAKDGKICGHSMAIYNKYRKEDSDVSSLIGKYGDQVHTKKYKGHEKEFWQQVQAFHDNRIHWNKDNTLSIAGHSSMEYILSKF